MSRGDGGYTGPERRQGSLSAKADELSDQVVRLNDSVRELTAYGRRNRFLIRWNIVASGLILVMAAAIALIAVQATETRQNAKLTCQIGNEARAGQIRLWSYVLDASSANPALTPQQMALIAEFRRYINEIFAQRDCNDPTPVIKTATPPSLPTVQPTR